MPYDAPFNTIVIGTFQYKVQPGGYNAQDLPYFATQRREGQPSFSAYVPEVPTQYEDWSHGFGQLYQTDDYSTYFSSNGLDGSIRGQLTLALYPSLTGLGGGASVGDSINFWIEFKEKLYAVGVQNVFVWNPLASPNGWSLSHAFSPQLCGQPAVFTLTASVSATPANGAYLIVPTASSQWFFDGSTWLQFATMAAHMIGMRNELWKVYYDANGVWDVAKTVDGVSYPNPNNLSIKASSGVATVNRLVNYDNRLYLMDLEGIDTLDSTGTVYDLVPEISDYVNPNFGIGSAVYHGLLYIPTNNGVLQFTGSTLLNPFTTHSLQSIGPDLNSWYNSDVRGTFVSLAPYVNYMLGAQNSDQGNGYLMKYRDYSDLQPGQGWHPLIKFPGQTMNALTVSALNWYGNGGYPIVWMSVGGQIYQARLPSSMDNPLLDSNVLYQNSGTLDFPLMDDAMPTLQKAYIRYLVDLSCPSGTSISMLASLDGGAFNPVGGTITATTGVLEFDFNPTSVGSKIQTRIMMTASVATAFATASPYIRSVVLHHLIRPQQRVDWQLQLIAEDSSIPEDPTTAVQKLVNLQAARNTAGPVYFSDLLGWDHLVTCNSFSYRQTDRKTGSGAQFLASVELEDYAVQTYATMGAYTMLSLTS